VNASRSAANCGALVTARVQMFGIERRYSSVGVSGRPVDFLPHMYSHRVESRLAGPTHLCPIGPNVVSERGVHYRSRLYAEDGPTLRQRAIRRQARGLHECGDLLHHPSARHEPPNPLDPTLGWGLTSAAWSCSSSRLPARRTRPPTTWRSRSGRPSCRDSCRSSS
jgi:hypothetical protein